MTPDQVELVARAFYTAEYLGDWEDAPDAIRAHFEKLARMAIALLGQQMAQCRSSVACPQAEAPRSRGLAQRTQASPALH